PRRSHRSTWPPSAAGHRAPPGWGALACRPHIIRWVTPCCCFTLHATRGAAQLALPLASPARAATCSALSACALGPPQQHPAHPLLHQHSRAKPSALLTTAIARRSHAPPPDTGDDADQCVQPFLPLALFNPARLLPSRGKVQRHERRRGRHRVRVLPGRHLPHVALRGPLHVAARQEVGLHHRPRRRRHLDHLLLCRLVHARRIAVCHLVLADPADAGTRLSDGGDRSVRPDRRHGHRQRLHSRSFRRVCSEDVPAKSRIIPLPGVFFHGSHGDLDRARLHGGPPARRDALRGGRLRDALCGGGAHLLSAAPG
ncbi:hypothetical protein EMIHUDRAFT_460496, partial [Emiliania huxleyi CCMP1516]|uniref:Uncharacterized protein n=2 Tax=Emiliania huxleyi TaxID=2903 RepID=A0A0D3KPA9_EMIH1